MSITDELREWAHNHVAEFNIGGVDGRDLLAIADRIDAEHEAAIKKLSADFEGQLYCGSFVNWAVMDKLAASQRDIEKRVSAIERKLSHRGER